MNSKSKTVLIASKIIGESIKIVSNEKEPSRNASKKKDFLNANLLRTVPTSIIIVGAEMGPSVNKRLGAIRKKEMAVNNPLAKEMKLRLLSSTEAPIKHWNSFYLPIGLML